MITRSEVAANNLISPEVLNVIPYKCECGADIAFTDSLRQIYCTNPRCHYKVASRLEAMAKKLRGQNGETCEGWGESTCITVCKEYGLKSPYQVFLLEDIVKNGGTSSVAAFEKKVKSICNPVLRKAELWKVVEYAGIPNIDTIAFKIFGGYHTLSEAYEDIETWQVPFIANKLGLKNADTSVMAVNVYNNLIQYKDELLFGEKQFEIYEPQGETLYMAITGGVSGFKNKASFVQFLNKRYNGKINVMLMNSVTSQVGILVADGDTGSNKFKNAKRLNEKHLDNLLKTGSINSSDIGKIVKSSDLHPIGELIMIGDSKSVIARLDRVYGGKDE